MAEPTTEGVIAPTVLYTSADRIRQLNAIDRDLNRLLTSAGLAIQALTNARSPSQLTEHDPNSDGLQESRKAAFTQHATSYFSLVKSVQVNLRRQVYALEEADIISAHASVHSGTSQVPAATPEQRRAGIGAGPGSMPGRPQQKEDSTMPITNGGLGNLDVGWLNSRTADVGKKMEVELWKEARALLEQIEQKSNGSSTVAEQHEREDMDLDDVARPPMLGE